MIYVNITLLVELVNVWICFSSFVVSADSINCFRKDLTTFGSTRILSVIINRTFREPETEVKWYFDSIEKLISRDRASLSPPSRPQLRQYPRRMRVPVISGEYADDSSGE